MSDQQGPDSSKRKEAAPSSQTARLRARLQTARERLIDRAVGRIIRLGHQVPSLRAAGYWLYGTATRYLPRGRHVVKLGQVGEGVYRGAQPSLRAFCTLKEMGVETVINLRPECNYERKFVERLGMRHLYLPMPALDAPTHEVTLDFLRAVTDPAHGPVFFHCFHGVDRTGTMAACLRLARDGWSIEQAIEEMRAYRLHEQAQQAKVAYVRVFAEHWAALPEAMRCEVLHRPLPQEAPAEVMASSPWGRLCHWVQGTMEGVRERWSSHFRRDPPD